MDIKNQGVEKQLLTFKLDTELFAIDVAEVREVLDFTKITKIPHTPAYMRGVINLRGSVVPVIDLRLKFGMNKTEQTIDTCIIVMEIKIDNDHVIIGSLADSVEEVFEINSSSIEPAPRLGTRFNAEFLRGIGKRDNEFIMILNIDKVFSSDELLMAKESTLVNTELLNDNN